MLVLGIESTCDETAVGVVRNGRQVLSNVVLSQVGLHEKFGGVVPEVAARAHLESMNAIVGEALERAGVKGGELDGVAVANCPGLIGCLLVGVAAAKGYAFAWGKPLVGVNHVQAHLYSVVLENSTEVPFPGVGLVMSGGHSSLYHVRGFEELERIGQTQDDAVGEAFDKVAAILKLGYPGGPLIDRLAERGDSRAVKFPLSHLEKESLNFSFSGLKTAVLYYVNGRKGRERDATSMSEQQKADVAASFQRVAAEMLVEKLRRAAKRFETRSILIGGGVSANRVIRGAVLRLGAELGLPVFLPEMRFCTDNGAMVAGMGGYLLARGRGMDAGLGLETVATV